MQKLRPSGWTSSPERRAGSRPRIRPPAWRNTGRASSGPKEPKDSSPLLPSSLPLLCIEHTLLEFTLPWHFFVFSFLLFSFEKDHSILPMPLQSYFHHHTASSSSSLSICPAPSWTNKQKDCVIVPPTPLYAHVCVVRIFYFSQCFQEPERSFEEVMFYL